MKMISIGTMDELVYASAGAESVAARHQPQTKKLEENYWKVASMQA